MQAGRATGLRSGWSGCLATTGTWQPVLGPVGPVVNVIRPPPGSVDHRSPADFYLPSMHLLAKLAPRFADVMCGVDVRHSAWQHLGRLALIRRTLHDRVIEGCLGLVRLVRQAKDRRLLLAGPAVRLDRYEHDLKAGSAGHGPVRLLASCTVVISCTDHSTVVCTSTPCL